MTKPYMSSVHETATAEYVIKKVALYFQSLSCYDGRRSAAARCRNEKSIGMRGTIAMHIGWAPYFLYRRRVMTASLQARPESPFWKC